MPTIFSDPCKLLLFCNSWSVRLGGVLLRLCFCMLLHVLSIGLRCFGHLLVFSKVAALRATVFFSKGVFFVIRINSHVNIAKDGHEFGPRYNMYECHEYVFHTAARKDTTLTESTKRPVNECSPAEAQRRGLRSGGTGRGWWLPGARCWPREASWPATGSQTNWRGENRSKQADSGDLDGSYSILLQTTKHSGQLTEDFISFLEDNYMTMNEISWYLIRMSLKLIKCNSARIITKSLSPYMGSRNHVNMCPLCLFHWLSWLFVWTFPFSDSFLNETSVASIGSYWQTCSMSNPGKNMRNFPFIPLLLLFSASSNKHYSISYDVRLSSIPLPH